MSFKKLRKLNQNDSKTIQYLKKWIQESNKTLNIFLKDSRKEIHHLSLK